MSTTQNTTTNGTNPSAVSTNGATPSPADSGKAASSDPVKPGGEPHKPEHTDAYTLLNVLTKREITLIFCCLMTALLLSSLDNTVVVVSLPVIVGDLGQFDLLPWVVSAYLLTSASTVPLYGKFSDIFGRRLVFQFAIIMFILGSVLCGVATSMWFLIAARAVQGCGAGGLQSLTMVIVGDIVAPRERGKYMGIMMSVITVSSIIGPLIGGGLTDGPGWRWCFWINIPFAGIAFVLASLYLNLKTPKVVRKIDIAGSFLIFAATVCLVLAIVWGGQTYAWNSGIIIGLLVASVVLMGMFLAVEGKFAAEPVMPLHLFLVRNFTMCITIGLLMGTGTFIYFTYLPYYFQVVQNKSATTSGLSQLPMMLTFVLGAMFTGGFISKTGKFRHFPTVGYVFATVGCGLFYMLDAHTSYSVIGVYQAIFGIGCGMTMPVINLLAQNAVTMRDMAASTSTMAFARTLGGALGVAIFGAVFQAQLQSNLGPFYPYTALEPSRLRQVLTGDQLETYLDGYASSLATMFIWSVPVMGMCWILSFFIQNTVLRSGRGTMAPPPANAPGKTVEMTTPPAVGDNTTSGSAPTQEAKPLLPHASQHHVSSTQSDLTAPQNESLAITITPSGTPPASQNNTSSAANNASPQQTGRASLSIHADSPPTAQHRRSLSNKGGSNAPEGDGSELPVRRKSSAFIIANMAALTNPQVNIEDDEEEDQQQDQQPTQTSSTADLQTSLATSEFAV